METREQQYYEAELITNYLLGIPVDQKEKQTYADAMDQLMISFSPYEEMLWKQMLTSRLKMACIDSGLALREPGNGVRRKLYTMLAILEASPRYTSFFISRKHSVFYLIRIAGVGIRAVFRSIVGVIIIHRVKSQLR